MKIPAIIREAIQIAEKDPDGSGYYLDILTTGGLLLPVVYDHSSPTSLLRLEKTRPGPEEVILIAEDKIVSVTVRWH